MQKSLEERKTYAEITSNRQMETIDRPRINPARLEYTHPGGMRKQYLKDDLTYALSIPVYLLNAYVEY